MDGVLDAGRNQLLKALHDDRREGIIWLPPLVHVYVYRLLYDQSHLWSNDGALETKPELRFIPSVSAEQSCDGWHYEIFSCGRTSPLCNHDWRGVRLQIQIPGITNSTVYINLMKAKTLKSQAACFQSGFVSSLFLTFCSWWDPAAAYVKLLLWNSIPLSLQGASQTPLWPTVGHLPPNENPLGPISHHLSSSAHFCSLFKFKNTWWKFKIIKF